MILRSLHHIRISLALSLSVVRPTAYSPSTFGGTSLHHTARKKEQRLTLKEFTIGSSRNARHRSACVRGVPLCCSSDFFQAIEGGHYSKIIAAASCITARTFTRDDSTCSPRVVVGCLESAARGVFYFGQLVTVL